MATDPDPESDLTLPSPLPDGPSTIIDPNGDVILLLSRSDVDVHLRVSSNVLSLASPVLAETLEPHFRNRSCARTNSLPSIFLTGDDPEAFTLLCNTIHFRTDAILQSPSPSCLENLAVICHKYKCASAIKIHTASWMRNHPKEVRDLHRLLVVAYALDIPEAFSVISWEILQRRVGPFFDLPGVTGHILVQHDLLGISASTIPDRCSITKH
jgi:hypothetical protein